MRKEVNCLAWDHKVSNAVTAVVECKIRANTAWHTFCILSHLILTTLWMRHYSHIANKEHELWEVKLMREFSWLEIDEAMFWTQTTTCSSPCPLGSHPVALCSSRWHPQPSSCTIQKPRNQTRNFPPLPHWIHYQFLSILYSQYISNIHTPIPSQPMVGMLVQAIIFYLDSDSYYPTGHPVSTVSSIQAISFVLTRVNLKSVNVSYHSLA